MNLRNKEYIKQYTIQGVLKENKHYKSEDVQKAILEFENELSVQIQILKQTPDTCLDIYNVRELLEQYKEIFGDFEK